MSSACNCKSCRQVKLQAKKFGVQFSDMCDRCGQRPATGKGVWAELCEACQEQIKIKVEDNQ